MSVARRRLPEPHRESRSWARANPSHERRTADVVVSKIASRNGDAGCTRSPALLMIPGFLALGAASLAMPSGPRGERALLRIAGVGTILAGLFRCSDVSCPDPTRDPEATASDSAHAIVSIATFVAWTALPFVDASHRRSPTLRAITVGNGVATAAGFVAAGLTQRSDDANKGIAQRVFLGSVFAWYVTRAFRGVSRSSNDGGVTKE